MGMAPGGHALGVLNVYDNANKAFNLLKGCPIGAVTWGAGGIGNASISSLVKDFRKLLKEGPEGTGGYRLNQDQYTIEEVATKLRRFIYEEQYIGAFANVPADQKPGLGFIVAGYGKNARDNAEHADEYAVVIDQGNCGPPYALRRSEESGVFWAGMGESLNRLILGFGTALPTVLQQNLGVPVNQIPAAMRVIQQVLGAQLAISAMPLKDAIDLAEFLADVAIKFSKFSPGANVVGGPIEIAAISKHEGFKWVKRKYYFDRELNPDEGEGTWRKS